jgi:predicted ATPase
VAWRRGDLATAQSCFTKALAVARHQEARHWELRATTSFACLWRDQGRRDDARDLLSPIYHWFTTGLETPDLTDAKALLDDLRRDANSGTR